MKQSTVAMNLRNVRKLFLAASFMLVVAGSSAWASAEPEISQVVKDSFKKEFMGAELLGWNEEAGFLKATFIFGNHRTQAFFSKDGRLEGTIRTLFYNQLPLTVMTAIDKRFANADIWDVNEINNSLGTVYRITLEVKHRKYRVKVDASGSINEIEKVKE